MLAKNFQSNKFFKLVRPVVIETENRVAINHDICHQFRNESTKYRNCSNKFRLFPT